MSSCRSSLPLPSAPSLEQLRKQAKDLLRAHRAGEPAGRRARRGARARRAAEAHGRPARRRARARLPELAAPEGLRRARRRARPRPRARLPRGPRLLRGPRLRPARVRPRRHRERRRRLRALGRAASREAGARAVVARRHGFASWAALRRHVAGLRDSGEPFARAYRAVEAHDVDGLRAQLETLPRPGRGGRHQRQRPARDGGRDVRRAPRPRPARRAAPTRRAATPTAGRRCTRRPTRNLPLLARMLLDEGVPVDVSARGDGGTPLVVALFWGHREVTEVLAEHGVHPRNLRAAAGLGRLDLVEELVAPDGRLAPEAGAHRAFYRPHSGFPAWQPGGRSAGGPRRGARLGRAQRPRRGARAARRARRAPRRRRLPRQRADVGRGERPRRRRPAAHRARRRPERPLDLRRPEPRRGRDPAAPRRPGRPPRRRAGAAGRRRRPARPRRQLRLDARRLGRARRPPARWRPQSASA